MIIGYLVELAKVSREGRGSAGVIIVKVFGMLLLDPCLQL